MSFEMKTLANQKLSIKRLKGNVFFDFEILQGMDSCYYRSNIKGVNQIITYLVEQLQSIGETVDILERKNG